MNKLLFVTPIVPIEFKKSIISYCRDGKGLNVPMNVFQLSIIDGLLKNNLDTDVLSVPSLPAFPFGYKALKIPHCKGYIEQRIKCEVIPYSTFFLWKYTSIQILLYKRIINWIKDNHAHEIAILAYSENPAFISAIKHIKHLYPKIKVAIVIADMIEDAHNFLYNKNILKQIQLTIHKKEILSGINSFDYYILLTDLMKQRIQNCRKYCVVEGIYKQEIESITSNESEKKKIIFYSGALDSYVNLQEMVEAFNIVNHPDYELVICGNGPLSKYVEEVSNRNKKIRYLGVIPREEVLQWQKKSSFLINPRQPSELTKFSFPSKIIEYFASGTPVIMYKLEGIPDEYYKYCYTIKGTTIHEFSESLKRILSLPENESREIGYMAREFILKNKNSKVQVRKIIDLIFNN